MSVAHESRVNGPAFSKKSSLSRQYGERQLTATLRTDMLTRTTGKTSSPSLPRAEATERKLTQVLVERELIHAQYEEMINTLMAERDAKLKPYDTRAIRYANTIHAYARRNKRQLKNSFKIGTSTMGWRAVAPSVQLSLPEKDVIRNIFDLDLADDFIRMRPTIDKNSMRAHPIKASRIPGVKVAGDRTFFIKPGGTELRIVRSSREKRTEILRPRRSRADAPDTDE